MALVARAGSITRSPRGAARWWAKVAPYVFISPFYLLFLAFGLLPILFSLGVSLFNWQGVAQAQFTGLSNYGVLLTDPDFLTALGNTVIVWLGSTVPMVFLALAFAAVLNAQRLRLRGFFRTVYFLPVVTSLVVTGLIFSVLFDPSIGLVNDALHAVGIAPINFLSDPNWMKPTLIMALLWRWTGNDMVIMLAGLQSIPGDIYEAATVDGATGRQAFWRITVPLMRPIILFDFIISTIGAFNLFEEPYVLFGGSAGNIGGTQNAGLVTGTLIYQNSFVFFNFGYGAAIAWVVAFIIFVLSMLQLKLGNKPVD
ncbi:MAG TPA: sugar ABC transporter permease [Chloroflexota bacterium]|nr:sugar ABC transporter permease [Chloroflexota bacterium]